MRCSGALPSTSSKAVRLSGRPSSMGMDWNPAISAAAAPAPICAPFHMEILSTCTCSSACGVHVRNALLTLRKEQMRKPAKESGKGIVAPCSETREQRLEVQPVVRV